MCYLNVGICCVVITLKLNTRTGKLYELEIEKKSLIIAILSASIAI